MSTGRCFRSISKVSSAARLVRLASRLQQGSCKRGLAATQIGILGRSTTNGQFLLAVQSKFGRHFTRSLYATTVVCDISRIPEILINSVAEGAGLDSDVSDDDDEMSSPVNKGKHRKNLGYKHS